MPEVLFDGRYRSAVTLPEYRLGMSPANKGKTYPVEVLSEEEFDRLLGAISRRGKAGKRNRAALALMWGCGLRIAEVLALEIKDIDLNSGTLTVLHGKGDKRRVLGIPPGCQAILEAWLQERRGLGIGPGRPVFCVITKPRAGRELGHAYLREAVHEYGIRAGIEKRCHPHQLRHSFAVRAMRRGVPMPILQRMLGHKSLATTERYLRGLNPQDVIDAMREDEWHDATSEPLAAAA